MFTLSQLRGSTIRFVYFEVFFLKILTVKKLSIRGLLPPLRGNIAPIYPKIMYDLTIAIINKYFEIQNDWLKIIRIRYKCMQFWSILLF